METSRINLRRLAKVLAYSLVLPFALALFLDYSLGWAPWVTIAAIVIVIPLSTIIVVRTTLAEFERVIQQVAPTELDVHKS